MKLLLDAVTLLWMQGATAKLSERARNAYLDPHNELFLSAISAYEIVVKERLGRLELATPAAQFLRAVRSKFDIATLAVSEESALAVALLPPIHRDPFDRVLIAQSIEHAMTIVTPDATIARYPIRVLW